MLGVSQIVVTFVVRLLVVLGADKSSCPMRSSYVYVNWSALLFALFRSLLVVLLLLYSYAVPFRNIATSDGVMSLLASQLF